MCWVNKWIYLSGPNSLILEFSWALNWPKVHWALTPTEQPSLPQKASLSPPQQGMSSLAAVDGIPNSCSHKWSPQITAWVFTKVWHFTWILLMCHYGFVKGKIYSDLISQFRAYRSGWLCSPLSWRSVWSKYFVGVGVGIEDLMGRCQLSIFCFFFLRSTPELPSFASLLFFFSLKPPST